MLEQLLCYLHNYFLLEAHPGTYEIRDGRLTLPFLQEGQYFRVLGSVFSDGVYAYPAAGLTDVTFTGSIWALAVPKEVEALAREIAQWQEKAGEPGRYKSESYGGYSHARYSYTALTSPETGMEASWREAFRGELNRWRKL